MVAAAVDGGARTVLVRDKQLAWADRLALASGVRRLLDRVGGVLLVASDSALAAEAGADGLHLAAADPWPEAPWPLVGRSCHAAADLASAAERCDYAFLSPIYPTASKPGYGPALGPLALAAPLPTWALGGITAPEQVEECLQAGFSGVALMGYVMRADFSGTVVAYLRAVAHRDTTDQTTPLPQGRRTAPPPRRRSKQTHWREN